MKVNIFAASTLLALLPTTAVATTSALWGTNGENWDPATSYLRDFTSVGYKNGNEPIPDWPVGVDVTDFGAIANDDGDDSQAFIDAIAACPDNHAVFVPKGKYVIRQQLRPARNNFVLRGEHMYDTILYFPQNLEEIYPNVYHDTTYGYRAGFWYVEGGSQKSIEKLTFEFREQTKGGFWEFRGGNAIKYRGAVTDSWIRDIHIRNAEFGAEFSMATRISILNIYYSHYYGRQGFITSAHHEQVVGYLGIGGLIQHSLFHNIEFTGNML